jgi:hypothetical protein
MGRKEGHPMASPEQPKPEQAVPVREVVFIARESGVFDKLTEREREVLQRRYESDPPTNFKVVGDSLNISRARADQLEKKALKKIKKLSSGEPLPTLGGQKKEIDEEKAEYLYLQGMTLEKIGEELGVSWALVRDRLISRGIKMRARGFSPGDPSHRPKIEIDNRILYWLYVEKKRSAQNIADYFNVSKKTILNRLREEKISVRRQGSPLQYKS